MCWESDSISPCSKDGGRDPGAGNVGGPENLGELPTGSLLGACRRRSAPLALGFSAVRLSDFWPPELCDVHTLKTQRTWGKKSRKTNPGFKT